MWKPLHCRSSTGFVLKMSLYQRKTKRRCLQCGLFYLRRLMSHVCVVPASWLTFCHLVKIPLEACFHQCPSLHLPRGWSLIGVTLAVRIYETVWARLRGSHSSTRLSENHQPLCCFCLAATNTFSQRRGHTRNTFIKAIQAWNCTCFEYGCFHFSPHSAAQMNQPKVIFLYIFFHLC